jgi:UDP-GlcNAc:undecaprenyl-phosphate GlcNAc-1-phosphate transferase
VLPFFTFIAAMFITMVLIPPLMKSAERFSFIDNPGERKIHNTPIPRIGGVAMVVGAVTPILMWADRPPLVLAFLVGIGVILVFGIWDDRSALDFRLKFLGQFVAISIVIFFGGVEIRYLPFTGVDPVPTYVSIPFTYFALLGVTNAINLADGLDGLAGGTMLLTTAAIALLAYMVGDNLLFVFCLAVMGSIIGFLRYNTFPAQIFMGDCGSQFLGFSVGVLVILLTQVSNPALSPSMTLLILGLPIIDTFIVMGQRVIRGGSPFSPDKNHVHHKLLAVGLDHYEAVLVIYVAQAALVTSAFVFRFESDLFVMSLFSAILLAIVGIFRYAEHVGWAAHERPVGVPRTPLGKAIRELRHSGVLSSYPTVFVAISVPVYVLYAVARTGDIPIDGAVSIFILFGLSMTWLSLYRREQKIRVLERIVVYIVATMTVYYWHTTNPGYRGLYSFENAYFVVLTLALALAYRFSRHRQFSITPTDFLVIFLAVIVPGFVGSIVSDGNIMAIGSKTVILFYAVELIVTRLAGRELLFRGIVAFVAGAMLLKALGVPQIV